MSGTIFTNENEVSEAYTRVRSNESDAWMLLKYDGSQVKVSGTGVMYDEFLAKLGDEDRAYGYIRVETGDEMSKRAKFVFITWVGKDVSPLKKARVSTDKGQIKKLICDFAVEKHGDDKEDISFERILDDVKKAGGANYGTGTRD